MEIKQHKLKAAAKNKEMLAFLAKLKQDKPRKLDQTLEQIHQEVFEKTDCLTCGNCCRTTGPLLLQKDIETLSTHLHLKPGQFIEKYLRIDEDKDYVFKTMPCPFWGTTIIVLFTSTAQRPVGNFLTPTAKNFTR